MAVLSLVLVVTACSPQSTPGQVIGAVQSAIAAERNKPRVQTAEGVTLHDCANFGGLRAFPPSPEADAKAVKLENTNPYPVRIRHVWQYQGEATQAIFRLGPGEAASLFPQHQDAFYIYTAEEELVGFIRARCP